MNLTFGWVPAKHSSLTNFIQFNLRFVCFPSILLKIKRIKYLKACFTKEEKDSDLKEKIFLSLANQ